MLESGATRHDQDLAESRGGALLRGGDIRPAGVLGEGLALGAGLLGDGLVCAWEGRSLTICWRDAFGCVDLASILH